MGNRKTRRVAALYTWDRLKVSFWFAPLVMALGAVLLAWVMYWVDGLIPNETLQNSHFILSGTPGEIRTILVGMAGTILATSGVVFTLLTLPLSTVAAQSASSARMKFNITDVEGRALTKYYKMTDIAKLEIENDNVGRHEAPVCDELGLPFRKKYS